MREADVERRLVERVKKIGGIAYKFTAPGRRSVPDRLVLLPGVRPFFVECKAPGKAATSNQEREHERIRKTGVAVYMVDSYEAVDRVIPSPERWRELL